MARDKEKDKDEDNKEDKKEDIVDEQTLQLRKMLKTLFLVQLIQDFHRFLYMVMLCCHIKKSFLRHIVFLL